MKQEGYRRSNACSVLFISIGLVGQKYTLIKKWLEEYGTLLDGEVTGTLVSYSSLLSPC